MIIIWVTVVCVSDPNPQSQNICCRSSHYFSTIFMWMRLFCKCFFLLSFLFLALLPVLLVKGLFCTITPSRSLSLSLHTHTLFFFFTAFLSFLHDITVYFCIFGGFPLSFFLFSVFSAFSLKQATSSSSSGISRCFTPNTAIISLST